MMPTRRTRRCSAAVSPNLAAGVVYGHLNKHSLVVAVGPDGSARSACEPNCTPGASCSNGGSNTGLASHFHFSLQTAEYSMRTRPISDTVALRIGAHPSLGGSASRWLCPYGVRGSGLTPNNDMTAPAVTGGSLAGETAHRLPTGRCPWSRAEQRARPASGRWPSYAGLPRWRS